MGVFLGVLFVLLVIGIIWVSVRNNQLAKKYGAKAVTQWKYNPNTGFKLTLSGKEVYKAVEQIKSFTYHKEDDIAILVCTSGEKFLFPPSFDINETAVKDINKKIKERKAGDVFVPRGDILLSTNKKASVVGRAVAGGIIAGPAGAVVGALSAVDKNNSKK